MNSIRTACGRFVRWDDPYASVAALPIETLAHSLAQINRFHGHAARPISVAEHSLLVVEIMQREQGQTSPWVLLAALLHDAHEIVTNDLAAPVKGEVGPEWRAFERGWEETFHAVFELRQVFGESRHRMAIKQADLVALATEQRDLFPPLPRHASEATTVLPVDWINLRSRDGMSWVDWRQAFVDTFQELTLGCTLQHTRAAHPGSTS